MNEEAEPPTAEQLFRRFLEREREGRALQSEDLLAGARPEVREEFLALREDYLILRRELAANGARLTPGRVLGGFRLVRPVGSGGMGVVWEAVQEGLGRSVALKVLHPHLLLSERAAERFRREAEAGGRLRHPALVLVHAIGVEEGVSFLAEELLEGGSLADRIALLRGADAPLSDEYFVDTSRLFVRLAEGLSAAHEAGILHRDVKASNVLFDRDGAAKLGDFGLATAAGSGAATLTGELAGTLAYASPEQLRGDRRRIDARTDVYSLGVSLFEALTLRRPFEGDAPHLLIRRILHDEPPDPRRLRTRIPRDLAVICLRAMEKSTASRYGSARELADDLGRFLRHEPVLAQPAGPLERGFKWCRRRPSVASLIALGLVSLITLSALLRQTAKARDDSKVLARTAASLLASLQEQGSLRLAETQYREAIDVFLEVFGRDSEEVLACRRGLAILWVRERRFDESLSLIDELLPAFERVFGRTHHETQIALRAKVEALHGMGQLDEARAVILDQLERIPETAGEDRQDALHYLATNAAGRGDFKEYVKVRQEQLQAYEESDPDGRAKARCSYAEALVANGRTEDARRELVEAVTVLGEEQRHVLMARALLAIEDGDWSTARTCYERARADISKEDDPLGEQLAVLEVRKALLEVAARDDAASRAALELARKNLPPQLVEWSNREPKGR